LDIHGPNEANRSPAIVYTICAEDYIAYKAGPAYVVYIGSILHKDVPCYVIDCLMRDAS